MSKNAKPKNAKSKNVKSENAMSKNAKSKNAKKFKMGFQKFKIFQTCFINF